MLKELKEEALILFIGVLLGAFIALKLFAPKVENSTTVTEETTEKIDSVRVDTVFMTEYKYLKPKTVKAKTEQSPEPEKYDSTRTYKGSYLFEFGKLDWEVETGGIMLSGKFNPVFDIPIKTITHTKTITNTKTILQRGLYAGGGINSSMVPHVGATYLGKKFLLEYNFVPEKVQTNSYGNIHQLGFKYKVF